MSWTLGKALSPATARSTNGSTGPTKHESKAGPETDHRSQEVEIDPWGEGTMKANRRTIQQRLCNRPGRGEPIEVDPVLDQDQVLTLRPMPLEKDRVGHNHDVRLLDQRAMVMLNRALRRHPLLIRLVDGQIVEQVIDHNRILVAIDQGLGGSEVGVDDHSGPRCGLDRRHQMDTFPHGPHLPEPGIDKPHVVPGRRKGLQ